MRKILVVLFVFVFSLFFVSALDNADKADMTVLSTLDGDDVCSLFRQQSIAGKIAETQLSKDNSFSVAIGSFISYPESWKGMSKKDVQLKVFNILTSFSTQKGITYISRTAGYKPRVLILDSYCISDVSDKESAVPDPVASSVPTEVRYYTYQKDNRFGGNTFAVDYLSGDDEVFMRIVNCTAMKYMGISCLEPLELSMFMDVIVLDDGLYLSGMATVFNKKPQINLVVYTIDLRSSFERRITAMKNWFSDTVMKTT